MTILEPLKMDQFRLVEDTLASMSAVSRIKENHAFIQHGTTTLYQHCRNVAIVSLMLANFFKARIDERSLVRGAILHDYYLYDWHDKQARPHLHGFFHPGIALKNAEKDFSLNKTERDIIKHHMFPLTMVPPKTKEGWLVTLADKACSLYETFKRNEVHLAQRRILVSRSSEKYNF